MNLSKAAALGLMLIISIPAFADTPTSPAPAPESKSAPSASDGKKPTLNIQVDPRLKKLDEPYQEAVKKLSKEQMETLATQEREFVRTAGGEIDIMTTALELKYCIAKSPDIAKDSQKYISEFGVYRNQIETILQGIRGQMRAKRVAATPFIDQKILDDHYTFSMRMAVGLAEGLMQVGYQRGSFEKTNCPEVVKKLDTAFSRASAAGKGSFPPAAEDKIAEIKKAAEGGDLDAMANLGMLYLSGNGVGRDTKKGLELLNQAAEKGYERAQYLLGLALATDALGIPLDKEKAKFWLGKAAAQGNKKAEAMLQIVDKQQPQESMDDLRKKAEAGDINAANDLGARYFQGLGTEKNHDEALKWLLLAAGHGHPLAQSDVAMLLMGDNRIEEGLNWMTKAAENGVSNSQLELAEIYQEGKLVPKDMDKAVFWYRKAASAGDSRATQALEKLGKQ